MAEFESYELGDEFEELERLRSAEDLLQFKGRMEKLRAEAEHKEDFEDLFDELGAKLERAQESEGDESDRKYTGNLMQKMLGKEKGS